ncbi:MAG: alkaline phosphatase family protein [Endomicrobiales bacterium]|nr:alkaline phosphatase family protein [Endomicrobiales bacterium]
MFKKRTAVLTILFLLISAGIIVKPYLFHKPQKLYWFIPDGMRAEPEVFKIFEWAENGILPNLKRMMEKGSYGYCKPVYPGHTPVNFATLFTGTYPEVHGVSDGPMHEEGNPLSRVSVGGFSSAAKKVEPIWITLENLARKVTLFSIPGSTPPELKNGQTIVGRWGGWGAPFYAVNFEDISDGSRNFEQGTGKRLFFFGPPLVKFCSSKKVTDFPDKIKSHSAPKKMELNAWGSTVYGYIYDSTNDNRTNYDRIAFTFDNEIIFADLKEKEWSEWLPIELSKKIKNEDLKINTQFKIKIILLRDSGYYRIRFFYNCINETLADPKILAKELTDNVGPMVDFVDNFPPQLIYYPEDKETFIEECNMSFDWHKEALSYLLDKKDSDIFIHDIYSPNQMLTSRWWLGYIDPKSQLYDTVSAEKRKQLWDEVLDMYKKLDDIIGVYLDKMDKNSFFILSSDHGAAPLHTWVNLNNLFAKKGWLKFKLDPKTGEPIINWRNSKVVYLKFDHIYVNPKGLHNESGIWQRASGRDYEALRNEVANVLRNLKDKNGVKPLESICTWENAKSEFRLPHERCGDLIIANRSGFGWNEKMTENREIFSKPLKTGYKQSIISSNNPCMWAPFVVIGPGVKKNNFLGDEPLEMVDQYPTILELLKIKAPNFVQGKPIQRIFENK